jgi:guanylate kinase
MRDGEQQGREYNFLGQKEFDRRVNEGDFIEHVRYGSHHYGTLKSEVKENLRSGLNVILEIELKGARKVREKMQEAVLIFIEPPSMEELHKRLAGRNTEESAERKVRLERAREELAAREEFDYIIVNQTVDQAADDLEQIIKTSIEGGSS